MSRCHWGSMCPGCWSMGTTGTLGAWGCQEHGGHRDTRSGGCREHKDTEPAGDTGQGPAALLCPIAPLFPQVISLSPLRSEGLRSPFQPHSQSPQTHPFKPLSCAGSEDSWDPAVPHPAQSHRWHRGPRDLFWVTPALRHLRRCHPQSATTAAREGALYSFAGETEAPGNPNERSDIATPPRAL